MAFEGVNLQPEEPSAAPLTPSERHGTRVKMDSVEFAQLSVTMEVLARDPRLKEVELAPWFFTAAGTLLRRYEATVQRYDAALAQLCIERLDIVNAIMPDDRPIADKVREVIDEHAFYERTIRDYQKGAERLKEWVVKYGRHLSGCSWLHASDGCTCGYFNALDSIGADKDG